MTLVQHMLAGHYNPGQLQIVREINYAPDADFDTAVFTGNRADYTIASTTWCTVRRFHCGCR